MSAGGSEFFDIVAAGLTKVDLGRPTVTVLRSGCYLTQDHLHYGPAFERLRARAIVGGKSDRGLLPALEVWGCVQSRPEPTRAYLTGGKRGLSYDMKLPQLIAWFRRGLHRRPVTIPPDHTVTALNDQHAHPCLPAESPLRVGDLVCFGIAHPCTTFDKWQLIYVVDDDYRVIDAIRTYF